MRGTLETIVGAMFAGKTSELLKRILWAEHQGKKILVIKPKLDNRYSEGLISTHNNLSHSCFPMENWEEIKLKFVINNKNYDVLFLDENFTEFILQVALFKLGVFGYFLLEYNSLLQSLL